MKKKKMNMNRYNEDIFNILHDYNYEKTRLNSLCKTKKYNNLLKNL
jgi:hypothetical protein